MIFLIVFCSVILLMNYVIIRGLIKYLHVKKIYKNILTSFVIIMTIFEIEFAVNFKIDEYSIFFYKLSAIFIGVSFIFFSVALVHQMLLLSIKKVTFSSNRREFLEKLFSFSALGIGLFSVFSGILGGFKKPKVTHVNLHVKKLKREFNIVQLSDVHIGKILKRDFLQELVVQTNALNPDIVAITGDLVDMDIEKIKDELAPLKNLKAKYGVFYVAGNHEYYHGVEGILEYLEMLGLQVLRNSSKIVGGVNVCGVYDETAKRLKHPYKPDIQKAISKNDESLPTILLAHQPKAVEDLPKDSKVDLILSGHTHAGQIFPFGLLVRLVQPYLYGLYRHNKNTHIFVSSGAGYWGMAMRFLAPSEIAHIKLLPSI